MILKDLFQFELLCDSISSLSLPELVQPQRRQQMDKKKRVQNATLTGSYRKIWVHHLWTHRNLGEWGWCAGGSGISSGRPEKEERKAQQAGLLIRRLASTSSRKTVLFCCQWSQSSSKYSSQETETAAVAQLRAIPSSCNKKMWNFCCATKVCDRNWYSQGYTFPPEIYKLIVQFSEKCHAKMLHWILSLRGISNLWQENTLVSKHLVYLTQVSMWSSPLAADVRQHQFGIRRGSCLSEQAADH